MENNLNVIHSLLKDKTINEVCFNSNLAFLDEVLPLSSAENASVQELISSLNSSLHDALADRSRVLSLLGKCVDQCNDDVFNSNAILWMQHSTQLAVPESINDELILLNKLLTRSIGNAELKKQISTVILPKIFDRFLCNQKFTKNAVLLKLTCLRTLLNGYSSSCSLYRVKVYKYLISTLKHYFEHDDVISSASRCLVPLHCCGNAGQQGVNYKERWAKEFSSVIVTFHQLIDSLYGDLEQMKLSVPKADEIVPINEFIELDKEHKMNTTMRYFALRRFCGVLTHILEAMFLCKYPVSKSFNVKDLMFLISRILSVTHATLNEASLTNDTIALGANLPFLHLYAFQILQAVIICAKRNLIEFSTLICKLCIQSLKWILSLSRASGNGKLFREVKSKAYETLIKWCTIAGSSCSIEVFVDDLLPILICDIESRKQGVTLLIDHSKKKGKRKRTHCNGEVPSNVSESSSVVQEGDEKSCIAAHHCLRWMLRNASVFVKPEHHKTIQVTVVNQLLDIKKCNVVSEYACYSSAECRLALYESLLVVVMEPHPKWISPLAYAVEIFHYGLNDDDLEIKKLCRHAINYIESINHPKAPSLQFKVDLATLTSKADPGPSEFHSSTGISQVPKQVIDILRGEDCANSAETPSRDQIPSSDEIGKPMTNHRTETTTDEASDASSFIANNAKEVISGSNVSNTATQRNVVETILLEEAVKNEFIRDFSPERDSPSLKKFKKDDQADSGCSSFVGESKNDSVKRSQIQKEAGNVNVVPEEDAADVDMMLQDFVDQVDVR